MRGLALIVIAAFVPGCWLVFDDHGTGDDQCVFPTDVGSGSGGAGAQPAPQRNPETLTCDSFGGGGCDPSCGPCAEATDLAPLPTWGFCGSSCESLTETACSADPACRVVKDARCAISLDCFTDFLGCFPTDSIVDPTTDCNRADSFTCSRSPKCTAFHRNDGCPLATDAPCPRQFGFCMPEGRSPGKCFAQAACDRLPPACPANTRAGVENGCFTDACIPLDLCEPQ